MFTNNSIANVALYLRKSRGDDESVLVKHRDVLESLCKSRNWRYVVYAEIGSGDSISMRPKMTQLLNDVELQMYDAVVVHDWERLGRGDLSDQDRIVKTFKRTSTKIVTANPYRVFDLLNEQDEQYSDFYSFLARQEYRAIKKRLIQGKKIGAKLGHWTNGTPPYPYEYNPETKGLIVNKSNKTYYRFIVESCLAGKSLNSIAWELNKMGVLSPRKKRWNENTIRRLLIDETHLGRIISNKTEGDICKRRPSSKDYKEFPREEWVIVDNCHEAVKTIEEHERILEELKKRKRVPGVRRIYAFSQLIKCGLCGRTMGFYRNKDKGIRVKSCRYYSSDRVHRCPNRGGPISLIQDEINRQIVHYRSQIAGLLSSSEDAKILDVLSQTIAEKEKEIQEKERSLERIMEAYEEGVYSLTEFNQRMESRKREISVLEEEILTLQKQFNSEQTPCNEEKLTYLDQAMEKLKSKDLTDKELNELYKTIIDHITWRREGNTIEVEVHFI